jgi:hypothetical protein
LQPVSNVKVDSPVHRLKHDAETVSTDEGMQIPGSEEHDENADSPRFRSVQPGANVKVERSLQSMKQDLEIVSIDAGIHIVCSEAQRENPASPRNEI